MNTFLQDTFLYSNFKAKNKQAFLKAYDLHLDEIYRFVFFKVNNREEAQDLTSQVFLNVWNHIQNNKKLEVGTLRAFLYTIARNTVIDHYRAKSKSSQGNLTDDDAETLIDERSDLHHAAEIKSEYARVLEMTQQLKDEYREIIILKYVEELSNAEIAKILNKTKGNVRILSFRALQALKELLSQAAE
jgi:RNA polymerase sigma-70 factor (ECF subfamily)